MYVAVGPIQALGKPYNQLIQPHNHNVKLIITGSLARWHSSAESDGERNWLYLVSCSIDTWTNIRVLLNR